MQVEIVFDAAKRCGPAFGQVNEQHIERGAMRLNLLDRADQPLGQNEVRQLAIAKQRIKIANKFDPAALVRPCLARPNHLQSDERRVGEGGVSSCKSRWS